jgi:hypothetical protein
MFVVGIVQRVVKPQDTSGNYDLQWPVVFEDEEQGFTAGTVAATNSRETSAQLADALNAVLVKYVPASS